MSTQFFPNSCFDDIPEDADQNYFSEILNTVCGKISFHTVLDVGCGTGVFSSSLKQKKECSLYGVDGSEYALLEARKRGFDEVRVVADFCSDTLPFLDDMFDLVICKDVFEHLLDPLFLLSQIRRVLIKDGYMLLHVPNHFSLYGRLRFLFTNNIDTFCYFPNSNRWNFPHIRFFTYEDLVSVLSKNGFSILDNLSYNFFSFPFRSLLPMRKRIARILINKYPSEFAEGFTLIVKKNSATL